MMTNWLTLKPIFAARGRRAPLAALFALAVYLLAVIGFSWSGGPFAQILAAISVAISFAHAARLYGAFHALALFSICLVVTFTIENIGQATGFPFGRYHFVVGADLPHVGAIPIIVGPLWFGMGYVSWIVAGILLGGAQNRLDRRFERFALPAVAAFVMTQWDLVMDPPLATLSKAWLWHDGGALFGVPLSNFLGWLATSWIFFQGYALYLARQPAALAQARRASRQFLALGIVFYLCAGLAHLTPFLLGQGGDGTDGAGHVWVAAQLRESVVAIMLFTMLFTSLLAALRLYDE